MAVIQSPKSYEQRQRQNTLLALCYRAQLDLEIRAPDLSLRQIASAQRHIARARIIALFGQ